MPLFIHLERHKLTAVQFAVEIISLIAFFFSTLIQNQVLENISALVLDATCITILFRTYRNVKVFKNAWLSLFIAISAYFVGDVIWIYSSHNGLDPLFNFSATLFYTVANIGMAACLLTYFFYRKTAYDSIQLFLDSIAISTVMMGLFWLLYYNGSISFIFQFSDAWMYLSFIAIICNFITVTMMFVIIQSSPAKKFPLTYQFMIMGLLMYVSSDLIYTYLIKVGIYNEGHVLDFFYSISFFLISLAGSYELMSPEKGTASIVKSEAKIYYMSKRIRILYVVPLGIVGFRGFNVFEVLFFVVVFTLHQGTSAYVRYLRNQMHLESEKALTNQLELLVNQRTAELLLSQQKFEKLSQTDPLTNLYNRRFFIERSQEILEVNANSSTGPVLLFMDLDNFKEINDMFGHEVGDMVLKSVAQRLDQLCDARMLLARLGGDEFVILLSANVSRFEIAAIAQRVVDVVMKTVEVESYQFEVGISVGISRFQSDGKSFYELMKSADIAMYHAKESGKGQYQFYSEIMSEKMKRKLTIQRALKSAHFNDEFHLVFQPQFRTSDYALVGVEALIRWNSSELGFVSPAEFIPIAEEIGVIVQIGEWVIDQCAVQIKLWKKHYNRALRIGINVSPKQLETTFFIANLEKRIHINDMDPAFIDLEITENSAMKSDAKLEEVLTVLAGMGYSISIDDFGTGYSSLSYIKRFDIDRLKIAKELIDEMDTDDNSYKIVHAIVLMSKGLGLSTIAEGVETKHQFDLLTKMGCDEVQGYYLAKPMLPSELERILL